MRSANRAAEKLGHLLRTNRVAKLTEIIVTIGAGIVVVAGASPFLTGDPLAQYAVIIIANVLVLGIIWYGLRLRGEGCRQFGLSLRLVSRGAIRRTILQSFAVFLVATFAFVFGAIVVANVFGIPEADMSGYDFLRGNLTALIASLAGVYVVSSFGEEVIYRAFLINRIAELGSNTKGAWTAGVVCSSIIFGLVHSNWAIGFRKLKRYF